MARAAVLEQYNSPFVVRDLDYIPLTEFRVFVRTGASPFCITDILNYEGKLGKVPPTVLGHASMGIIEEIGSGVSNLRVGQRVIVPGTPECGHCFYCNAGQPWQCSELFDQPNGYMKVAHDHEGRAVEGAGNVAGYSELMNVSQNQVWPIESDLPDEVLGMFGCGVTTGLGIVFNIAEVKQHESVVIVGAGHVGLWALQAAKLAGAGELIVVEPDASRRAVAEKLGATLLIDPSAEDAVGIVKGLTGGRGADQVIEAAGPTDAQTLAVELSRRGGTVVLSGVKGATAESTFNEVLISAQSRRILGCQNGNVRMGRDIPRFARLIEEGKLDPSPIMTRTYGLSELNEAMENSRSHGDICGVIIPSK